MIDEINCSQKIDFRKVQNTNSLEIIFLKDEVSPRLNLIISITVILVVLLLQHDDTRGPT